MTMTFVVKRIRTSFCLLFAAIAILVVCSGCRSEPALQENAYYAFTDSMGREVSLPRQPQRVAVLFSSYADIWTLAGGSVDITVGEAVQRGFAPEDSVLVDSSAGHTTIDLEALVQAAPDLVIGTADYACQVDACSFCAENGIPSAVFRVECLEDYCDMLKICCDITGKPENYTLYGEMVEERIAQMLSGLPETGEPPRILFLRAGTSARSTKAKNAENNFVCAMLEELGAYNIADSAQVLLDSLSIEAIVQENPDFIFISTMGDEIAAKEYVKTMFAQNGWSNLSAVKNRNYCFLEKELFHFKPNANWDKAYQQLIELLYEQDGN